MQPLLICFFFLAKDDPYTRLSHCKTNEYLFFFMKRLNNSCGSKEGSKVYSRPIKGQACVKVQFEISAMCRCKRLLARNREKLLVSLTNPVEADYDGYYDEKEEKKGLRNETKETLKRFSFFLLFTERGLALWCAATCQPRQVFELAPTNDCICILTFTSYILEMFTRELAFA